MSFRTITRPLTADQRERNVIYSSELVVTNKPDISTTLHEVFDDDPRKYEIIRNLEDVSFFKGFAKTAGYNVINYVHR